MELLVTKNVLAQRGKTTTPSQFLLLESPSHRCGKPKKANAWSFIITQGGRRACLAKISRTLSKSIITLSLLTTKQQPRHHHHTRWEERSACLAKISPTLEASLDAAWAGMNQYWDTRGDYDDNICTKPVLLGSNELSIASNPEYFHNPTNRW